MKISSASDNKSAFLLFHENHNPNFSKKNLTKTRTDANYNNLFNFNNNSNNNSIDSPKFGFNNTLRTKFKPTYYPTLNSNNFLNNENSNNSNNNLFNNPPVNLNTLLQNIKDVDFSNLPNQSNSKNNGQNINIILFAPNIVMNNTSEQSNNRKNNDDIYMRSNTENNICSNRVQKSEKKLENDDREGEYGFNSKKKKRKFDEKFNLLEDQLGNTEMDQIVKEFWHLKIKSSYKKQPNFSGEEEEKFYTNTGDSFTKNKKTDNIGNSVNYFSNDDNEKIDYDKMNPYSKNVNKK